MAEQDNNSRTLVIDEKSIYKFKVENDMDFGKSFFHEVYEKAEQMLSDIRSNSKQSENDSQNKIDNDFNNIIAFVGERGSGKTSSMLSFSESLRNKNKPGYHILDMVDPSVFDDSRDSIVEIIVSTMFKKFKEDLKDNKEKNREKESSKLDLIKQFEAVYRDIKILNGDKKTIFSEADDGIDGLINLSSAINMKKHLSDLIQKYLTYMASKSDFLVISIDDLDMNIASGEKMIEEIRKYLVMPKVIILMAIRFEQMEMVVKQKNIRELNQSIIYAKNFERQDEHISYNLEKLEGELENKKNKYLEKIIPYNKRIFMPDIRIEDVKIKIKLGNIDEEFQSISLCLAELYYDYMRYIFVTMDHYNVIRPTTLRKLIEIIYVFSQMRIGKEHIGKNISEFEKFISETMIAGVFNTNFRKFLDEINTFPICSINKNTILFLNNYFMENMKTTELITKENQEVSSPKYLILERSVKFGDVISWLKQIENKNLFIREKDFVELFKLIYSLRLVKDLYSDETEIISLLGNDIVGKYFEIADTRYWKDINSREIKNIGFLTEKENIREDDVNIFYQMLEPNYILQNTSAVLSRFYVQHVYKSDEKINKFESFKFKPLNILGIGGKTIFNEDKQKNDIDTIYSRENRYKVNNIDPDEYLLICNMDFFMKILNEIDSISKNKRIDNISEIKRIEIAYETANKAFNELCNVCKLKNMDNIYKKYCNKLNIADENVKKIYNIFQLKYDGYNDEKLTSRIDDTILNVSGLMSSSLLTSRELIGSVNVVRPRAVINQIKKSTKILVDLRNYITERYEKYTNSIDKKKIILQRFKDQTEKRINGISEINESIIKTYESDFEKLKGILWHFIDDEITQEESKTIIENSYNIIDAIIKDLNNDESDL